MFLKINPYLAESISGWIGGGCGIFATHPLDTIRVRQQVGGPNCNYLNVMKEILRYKGFLGFYGGVIPPVFFRGFAFSVNRSAYANTQRWTNKPYLLGFSAGFWSSAFEIPIYVLKNRTQVMNKKFRETIPNYFRMALHVCRIEGWKGLYTGSIPHTILSSGSYGVFYVVYEWMIEKNYNSVLSGCCSCWASWPLFYPLDVIRTRMQIIPKLTKWNQKYFTFSFFCNEMANQPFKQWFPGIGMTILRAGPRFGVCMGVSESVKGILILKE